MLLSAAGREERSADNESLGLGTDRAVSGSNAHSAVEGPLLDRVEAYSALVGILVVLGALVWQARGRE